jgi:hypothetical protein
MAKRRIPVPEVTKILMLIVAAVAIIVTKDSCGKSVKNLFDTVAPPSDGAADAGHSRR